MAERGFAELAGAWLAGALALGLPSSSIAGSTAVTETRDPLSLVPGKGNGEVKLRGYYAHWRRVESDGTTAVGAFSGFGPYAEVGLSDRWSLFGPGLLSFALVAQDPTELILYPTPVWSAVIAEEGVEAGPLGAGLGIMLSSGGATTRIVGSARAARSWKKGAGGLNDLGVLIGIRHEVTHDVLLSLAVMVERPMRDGEEAFWRYGGLTTPSNGDFPMVSARVWGRLWVDLTWEWSARRSGYRSGGTAAGATYRW